MERLKKQIGDRELEIDDLVKKSREDLWKADLDEFIKEWRFQLEDEDRRRKKVMKMGRRASQKLRIGAAGPTSRKRKANGHGSDDDDFGVSKAAKKTAAVKQPKPKGGLLSEPLAKANQPKPRGPKPKAAATKAAPEVKPEAKASDDIWMNVDASPSEAPVAPIFQKAKAAAAPFKSAPAKEAMSEDEDDDDDEEEVVRKPVARRARAAASKPVSYELDSESDDNRDDLLFDVGKMVKGINGTSTESAGRPLFSTASSLSRPGSSHGLPKKPASRRETSFDGADETDYSKLAPPTTKKGSAVTAKHTVLSDEEDDSFGAMMATAAAAKPTAPAKPMPKPAATSKASSKAQVPKPSKPTAKAKAKAAVKDALAVSAAPPPLRKMPLSPAAKAYAAKQARKPKKVLDDGSDDDGEDEVEKMLNEIISDDEVEETGGGGVAARRPARRAAAAAAATTGKKAWVVESGSDEKEEEEEEESAMFDAEDSDDF